MSVEKKDTAKILFNCYFTRSREGEQFVPEHVFGLQVSGTLTVTDGKKTYIAREGDFRFSRRNQLAKFVKEPPAQGEFKSLSIYLDQETLRSISKELDMTANGKPFTNDGVIALKPHPLYQSFMDSLLVYLQLPEAEQRAIMDVKVKEAVLLLLKVNPELRNILFDFNDPGKIDLEAFMKKNFQFNVSLNRFAYLTGRSLSTFKRDFEKIFSIPPGTWLLKQRLQEAYYLIKEKGKSPSDVYLEVGFEDLSHFSYAFKKQYGASPGKLIASR